MAGEWQRANLRRSSNAAVYFFDRLEEHASATALIAECGQRVSYAELAQRADNLTKELGSRPRLLLLGFRNTLNCIAAYLGALRHGHPVILVDPTATEKIEAVRAKFHVECMFDDNEWVRADVLDSPIGLHPELALLLGTSGSSGSAKLVRLSKENVASNAHSILQYLNLTSRDCAITNLPLFYSYGLSVLNSHLGAGASVVLTDKSVADPAFWSVAVRDNVTHLAGVPYTYELLERVRFRERAPTSLRVLTQAGGRMPADLVKTYGDWARARGTAFFVMYGQTEATARIAYVPPGQLAGNEGAIGQAIPGGSIRLVDEDGRDATLTAAGGELVYSGPNVMLGYASTRADLARGRDVSELATGDLAKRDPSGLFRIVGRKSRFCKPFGVRVGLDDLEGLLKERGLDALVTGSDELIAVALRSTRGARKAKEIVEEAARLPSGMVYCIAYREVPRLPSGKPDYKGILQDAQILQEGARTSHTREDLRSLYERAFPGKLIDDASSFELLGGDSLTYVATSIEIEDRLGVVPDGWERMTLAELGALSKRTPSNEPRFSLLETDILLRFVAIGIVVFDHARNASVTPGIFGGAELFLVLAGVALWRFQLSALGANKFGQVVRSFLQRVIAPYYALLICYALFWEWPGWSSLLLISTFEGRFKSILEPFWFMETLAHCYLLLWALSKLQWLRVLAAKRAFAFSGALVIIGCVLHLMSGYYVDYPITSGRSFDRLFVLVGLGCAAAAARTPVEKAAVAAVAVALSFPLLPPGIASPYPMIAGLLILMLTNRIPLPVSARGPVIWVADAGFAIYLVHQLPIWAFNQLGGSDYELVKMALAIVFGVTVHRGTKPLMAALKRLRLSGYLVPLRRFRSSEL